MSAEGASPAIITDHRFEPRVQEAGVHGREAFAGWVYVVLSPNEYLCQDCGLAESAHAEARGVHPLPKAYRCPECVESGRETCAHEGSVR